MTTKRLLIIASILISVAASVLLIESELYARVTAIAAVCLILWLTEAVPPFVPTLLLWVLIPLALGPVSPTYNLRTVLTWASDPVLALFFGGFALGLGAERTGLARKVAEYAVRVSGDSFNRLLFLVIVITAFFSMWLSNIAAAALMIACLRPSFSLTNEGDMSKRILLLGVALAADLGGMATPIGTGPNAVAIATLSKEIPVSFVGWMTFALPLTIGMLGLAYVLLRLRVRMHDGMSINTVKVEKRVSAAESTGPTSHIQRVYLSIFIVTVTLWLTEPIHHIPAAVVSIGAAIALFSTGVLGRQHLAKIDWSTLLLISGGITLGKLLETSGLVTELSTAVPFHSFNPTIALFLICFFTALLAALMSNTASVILMIPIATALIPSASTPILVAISASFGIPFMISTPPNAMAYGEGGLKFSDLFWPGLLLMLLGCVLVATTGPMVLGYAGIK